MRISISDELADVMAAGLKSGQPLEQEVERRLQACAHVHGRAPLIVLDTTEMDAIAERIGTGLPIRAKVDLLRAIDQTAQLKMGSERLVFTPSQLKQIEEKARRIGETAERLIGRIASKIITDVFLIEPGDQGVFYTPGFDPEAEYDKNRDDDTPGVSQADD